LVTQAIPPSYPPASPRRTCCTHPNGGITATPSGNLYGTNYQGGPGERGTLFEITGSGFVVPEPSSLSLVMLGLVPLLRRRRSLDRGKYTFDQDR
jgi:uncharacterized repeat protein (TIGR03803 family)